MLRIRITPAELLKVADEAHKTHQEISKKNSKIVKQISSLLVRQNSLTAERFYQEFLESQTKARTYIKLIHDMETQLKKIAKIFDNLDESFLPQGPNTLKELQTTDLALYHLSNLAYIPGLTADWKQNLKTAIKNEEDKETIESIKYLMKNNWKILATSDSGYNYQGVALKNPNGEVVISHRGTEPHFLDFATDLFNVVGGMKGGQVKESEKFTDTIQSVVGKDVKIVHTGHSLGGYLAQKNSMDKDSVAVTFNAPGFNDIYSKELGKNSSNNIRDYTFNGDPVSDNILLKKPSGSTHEMNLPPEKSINTKILEKVVENSAKLPISDVGKTLGLTGLFMSNAADSLSNKLANERTSISKHFLSNFDDYFKETKSENIKPR